MPCCVQRGSSVRELVVLRHGEGEGNARGLVQGRMDLPLTERGRGQARMAAELLRAHRWVPAQVVSSPQQRCLGTATLVCEALGLEPPVTDEAFVDLDVGQAEGRTMAELVRAHPEVFAVLNICRLFRASITDKSLAVVTMSAPDSGACCVRVRAASPVPGGRSMMR